MDNTLSILNQILGVVVKIEKNSRRAQNFTSKDSKIESQKKESSKIFSGVKDATDFKISGQDIESAKNLNEALVSLSLNLDSIIDYYSISGISSLASLEEALNNLIYPSSIQNFELYKNALDDLSNSLLYFNSLNLNNLILFKSILDSFENKEFNFNIIYKVNSNIDNVISELSKMSFETKKSIDLAIVIDPKIIANPIEFDSDSIEIIIDFSRLNERLKNLIESSLNFIELNLDFSKLNSLRLPKLDLNALNEEIKNVNEAKLLDLDLSHLNSFIKNLNSMNIEALNIAKLNEVIESINNSHINLLNVLNINNAIEALNSKSIAVLDLTSINNAIEALNSKSIAVLDLSELNSSIDAFNSSSIMIIDLSKLNDTIEKINNLSFKELKLDSINDYILNLSKKSVSQLDVSSLNASIDELNNGSIVSLNLEKLNDSISILNNTYIESLDVSNLNSMIDSLNSLGVKNINLSKINGSIAKLNSAKIIPLDLSSLKESIESLKEINKLERLLDSIDLSSVSSFLKSLDQNLEIGNTKNVAEKIKDINSLFKALSTFGINDSLESLKKIESLRIDLSAFLTSIVKPLSELNIDKAFDKARAVSSLIETLANPDLMKNLEKLRRIHVDESIIKDLVLSIIEPLGSLEIKNAKSKGQAISSILGIFSNDDIAKNLKKIEQIDYNGSNLEKLVAGLAKALSLEASLNKDAAISIVKILEIIADPKFVKNINRLAKLKSNAADNLIEFVQKLSSGLESIPDMKELKNLSDVGENLSKALISIAGAIAILTGIAILIALTGEPLMILGIVGALVVATIGILYSISKMSQQIEKSNEGILNLTKSMLLLAGFVASMLVIGALLVSADNTRDILFVTSGLIVGTLLILGTLVLFNNLIKQSKGSIEELSKATLMLTGAIGGILAISFLLTLTSNPMEILGITSGLVLGTLATILAIVLMNNVIKKSQGSIESLAKAMFAITGTIVALVAVAAIISYLDNPLEILGIAGALLLGEIALIAAVGYSSKMMKNSAEALKNLSNGILALTGSIALVIGIAIVIRELGNPLETLGIAGLILVGMVGLLALIAYADKTIGFDKAGISLMKMAGGLALMTLSFGLLLLCMSYVMIPLIDKIRNTQGFWEGLGAIGLVVISLVGLTVLLGTLIEKHAMIAVGGLLTLAGIAGILYALSLALDPLIDLTTKISGQSEAFWKGLSDIGIVLGLTIGIVAAIGALVGLTGIGTIIAVAGLATLAGIAGAIGLLGNAIDTLSIVALKIGEQSDIFWKGLNAIESVVSKMVAILTIAGGLSVFIGLGTAVLIPLGSVLSSLSKGIDQIVDLALKIGNNKNVVSSNIKVLGSTINDLIETLDGISILSAGKVVILSKALDPLLSALGKYVEIISQMGNQTFLKGYDDNGNPIYERINVNYHSLGSTIGMNFTNFVLGLLPSLETLSKDKAKVLKYLGEGLIPIMTSLGGFVEALAKISDPEGMFKIVGYDKDGKPIYSQEKVSYASIASNIGLAFTSFVNLLGSEFEKLTPLAAVKIAIISKALNPVVDIFSTFTSILEKISDPKIMIGSANSLLITSQMKSLIFSLTEDSFIKEIDENSGKFLTKSKFGKIKSALSNIANTFEAYDDILKLCSEQQLELSSNSLTLADDLVKLTSILTASSLIDTIDSIDLDELEKVNDMLDVIKPTFKYLEDLGKIETVNVELNANAFVNALNSFAKIDLMTSASTIMTSASVFSDALNKIDEALTKNKDKRLEALKEFTSGAVKLSESIDKISNSVRNVTSNDKKELDYVIAQLKEIEKARLEESTIKLQYEQKREQNLVQEVAAKAEQTRKNATISQDSFRSGQATNNQVGTVSNAGASNFTPEMMQAFARHIAQEVSEAVVMGLTTGIKKFTFDFRNNTDEIVGALQISD